MKGLFSASLVFLLPAFQGSAQNFETALNILATQHQPEKIYIQYDKEYYSAGETIWFKAYLYSDGKPGIVSSNLFLQFTNSKGGVVCNKRFPITGAAAKGSIDIPDSLSPGNYYIRALTPGMLNYDEIFIYKKNIVVLNPGATGIKEKITQQNVSVQFFPESGKLVDGIITVVGFKATDQWGTAVEINGIIRQDDGTTIAPFKSYHDGIGKLQFKAQAGKKYVAETEYRTANGIEIRTFLLPEVVATGISLKIEEEKGGKKFQLSRGMKNRDQFENIWLVAQINNHVVYENEIAFENYPSVIGHLVTGNLPSGILHFAVFNKDKMPLAERLSFVDNREYESKSAITLLKINSEKRGENSSELNFTDTIQRTCSVSITDASASSFEDNSTILSRFLLTSDLKGYVWNPAWYFADHTDTTKKAMDNLLLTHVWSRFNWSKILANEFPSKKYTDQPLISITGKVTDEKKKEPLFDGILNIYLEGEDSASQSYEVPVDVAGNFKMDSLLIFGRTKLVYVYTDSKGKKKPALVSIDDNPLVRSMEIIPAGMLSNTIVRDTAIMNVSGAIKNAGENLLSRPDEIKELEKVTIKTRTKKTPVEIVNEKYTSGVFRSDGKVNLDNINDPANDKSLSVVDYIKNRISQVELQGNQFVNRKNFSLQTGQKWAVAIFLNEIPVDVYQLRVMRTDDIALVNFFEAGFVGVGSSFPGGALAIYTKEKFDREEKVDKLNDTEYSGYSISKEYFAPDYNSTTVKYPASDKRTTLYWNPEIYTNSTTTSLKLKFFNNNGTKKFKVVIEGFDAAGKNNRELNLKLRWAYINEAVSKISLIVILIPHKVGRNIGNQTDSLRQTQADIRFETASSYMEDIIIRMMLIQLFLVLWILFLLQPLDRKYYSQLILQKKKISYLQHHLLQLSCLLLIPAY